MHDWSLAIPRHLCRSPWARGGVRPVALRLVPAFSPPASSLPPCLVQLQSLPCGRAFVRDMMQISASRCMSHEDHLPHCMHGAPRPQRPPTRSSFRADVDNANPKHLRSLVHAMLHARMTAAVPVLISCAPVADPIGERERESAPRPAG